MLTSFIKPISFWRVFVAGIVLFLLLISLTQPQPSAAAIRFCRTDPIVLLSNGKILQTDVAVWAAASEVEEVLYQIHLPVGVAPLAVIHTPSPLMNKEHVVFFNDNAPGFYDTVTTIHLSEGIEAVLAESRTRFLSVISKKIIYQSYIDSGLTGNPLVISIGPIF